MYYIAYGSNLNYNQMAYRCPNSFPVCKGIVKNYRLVFNVHADIIPDEEAEVPVLLWNIGEADWKNLDKYEGYPRYYVKKEIPVDVDGTIIPCIAYVMADDRKGFSLPYNDYCLTILEGYNDNGLNYSYLREAIRYTMKKSRE